MAVLGVGALLSSGLLTQEHGGEEMRVCVCECECVCVCVHVCDMYMCVMGDSIHSQASLKQTYVLLITPRDRLSGTQPKHFSIGSNPLDRTDKSSPSLPSCTRARELDRVGGDLLKLVGTHSLASVIVRGLLCL